MNQIEIVQGIYAAFGRQDVPAILERLAPDVDWEYGYADVGVPWLERRRGRDGARQFFESLAEIRIERFEVAHLLGQGPLVVALINIEFVVARTGRRVVEREEVHLWHFNAEQKVERFRHVSDTLQHWRAWQG